MRVCRVSEGDTVSNSNGPASMIRQLAGALHYLIMATAFVVLHWSTIFVLKLVTFVWKIRKAISPETSQQSQRPATSSDEETPKQPALIKSVSENPAKPDPDAPAPQSKTKSRIDETTTDS